MTKIYDATFSSIKTHKLPDWYNDYKFGIFVHWGIYSVPAYAPPTWQLGEVPVDENWFCNNPYAEWYYNSINVGKGPTYEHHVKTYGEDFKYEQFAPMWKAENWDPNKWAHLFKNAGAKYVVLTTKHHDGFCLFPSEYTEYNSVNIGPQKNIVGDLTESVRNAGLKMGLYYSGIIDWMFANNPIFDESENFSKACPTFEYADYAYKQSKELIDTYKPSVFWNDIGWPKQGEFMLPHLFAHYYNTVKDGVVNDRWNGIWKDFSTKEYQQGKANRNEKWEMTRGLGLSFGYNQNEGSEHLISVKDLVSLLVGTVANNGNLLLNVGPKGDGTIPEEQEQLLLELGKWLDINGEAIYETRCSDDNVSITDGDVEIHFTEKDDALYIILDKLPGGNSGVFVPKVFGRPTPIDKTVKVTSKQEEDGLIIDVIDHVDTQYAVVLKVDK